MHGGFKLNATAGRGRWTFASTRVHQVGFTPLAELLDGVAAAVVAGATVAHRPLHQEGGRRLAGQIAAMDPPKRRGGAWCS